MVVVHAMMKEGRFEEEEEEDLGGGGEVLFAIKNARGDCKMKRFRDPSIKLVRNHRRRVQLNGHASQSRISCTKNCLSDGIGCRILIIQRRVKVVALLVGEVAVVMTIVSFCFLGARAGARG